MDEGAPDRILPLLVHPLACLPSAVVDERPFVDRVQEYPLHADGRPLCHPLPFPDDTAAGGGSLS